MTGSKQSELLGLNLQQLTDVVASLGEPAYRAKQLFHAIYGQRLTALDEITTLSRSLRAALDERFAVGVPTIQNRFESVDGTIRYLIEFADGQSVETVWMPEGDGGESGDGSEAGAEEEQNYDRATICVSSQVGCAVNCQFCMTAMLGIQRNLTAGEIVGQIISVLNDRIVDTEKDRINLVFMGMGEPFLNYDNFMKAVRLLVDGVGTAESRMTVSTSGIVPQIAAFGREGVRPKLAISLNGSNDEVRSRVMPINRKWNLSKLMNAARAFPLRSRERITFEYVLLHGVNDAVENARELVKLVQGLKCKVNLIALNAGPGIAFQSPEEENVRTFQEILRSAGIPVFVRRPRGRDIYAACGQLKRTVQIGA